VKLLSNSLQELAMKNRIDTPLLIAADQEGGIVARLNHGFTVFPGNKALGMTGNPSLAKAAALAMGLEMQAAGVNMNLAPVVDVNIELQNPVIGVRSYSDNPETVVAFGKEALEGFKEAQILTTLKHFPGHGDVRVDSHESLPHIDKSMQELEQNELLPFAKLSPFADAVMTAHLMVPALDPDHCSTLSEKTLTYLKNKIGFKGLIVTDSLMMEGVLREGSVNEVAILALKAGCDMLCLGGKQLIKNSNVELGLEGIKCIHSSIVQAVQAGRISEERINDAVGKILKLKARVNIHPSPKIGLISHKALAKQIACAALEVIPKNPSRIHSIHQKQVCIFASELLRSSIHLTSFPKIGKTTDSMFFTGLSPSEKEIESAKQQANNADLLLICSYNSCKNPSQESLIQSLLDTGKPVVLVVVRDPLDASLFPNADLTIKTFSPTCVSIQAACDHLTEHFHS